MAEKKVSLHDLPIVISILPGLLSSSQDNGKEARSAKQIKNKHGQRVQAHIQDLAARPKDDAHHIGCGQQNAEASQVDIGILSLGEGSLSRKYISQEKEHRQKGI